MASQTTREQKLYDALKRITLYDQPERIRKLAASRSGYMGLDADEAIEMAYENVIQEARSALRGIRRPK